MGTRELILTLGALVLFLITSLSANKALVYHKEKVWEKEFEAMALMIAQQYIEEAKTKAFDVVVVDGVPTGLPYSFTSPGGLGPRSDEHYPYFNDIDDFNGFADTLNTPRGNYVVSIEVGYVSDTTPDSILTSPTYFKKMKINVSSPELMMGPIPISHVFAYWGEAP